MMESALPGLVSESSEIFIQEDDNSGIGLVTLLEIQAIRSRKYWLKS